MHSSHKSTSGACPERTDSPDIPALHSSSSGMYMDDAMKEKKRTGFMLGTRYLMNDLWQYFRVYSRMGGTTEELSSLFNKFLIHSIGRKSLYLHYGRDAYFRVSPLLGPNWLAIDLEQLAVDAAETAGYSLCLPANHFDAVLCTGLQRAPQPERLLNDIRRGLKLSGHIWIEVSLNAPHKPAPDEYWRITPKGLQIMMRDFDEIFCAAYSPNRSPLRSISSFYGLKRADEPGCLSPDAGTVDSTRREAKQAD